MAELSNNPTGAVAGMDFFEEAVEFARSYDIVIAHDAPYCDLTFDGYRAHSILEVPGAIDLTIEFNSLSKLIIWLAGELVWQWAMRS